MKNTKFILLPIILAVVVSGVTIFSFTADSDIFMSQSDDEVYSYVPSDITNNNPNIMVSDGSASMTAMGIPDVAEKVEYTIKGTVLDIGDPMDWYETNLAFGGHGAIPVTITVENVYKGNIDSDTFTFFLGSMIMYEDDMLLTTTIAEATGNNKIYYVHSSDPQFEIGEKLLVHINSNILNYDYIIDPDDRETMTPYYKVILSKYGKYQIQDGMAFNEIYPDGRPINDAIQESQQ